MKKTLMLLVVGTLCLAGSVLAEEGAKVTVKNNSDWDIHHFYVAEHGPGDDWGPDQLGDGDDDIVKAKGGSFTLKSIECGVYDVKIVASDNDTCIVEKVTLCDEAKTWTITNDYYSKCKKD